MIYVSHRELTEIRWIDFTAARRVKWNEEITDENWKKKIERVADIKPSAGWIFYQLLCFWFPTKS